MKLEVQANRWFAEGVKCHQIFNRAFKQARENAINAGFFFMSARELVPHGEWSMFCELHAQEIPERTVRFYLQLAESAIEWVKSEQPGLKKISEVHAAAREMVMQSPKPLVALCRELGHLRKFGEYDAVKYAQKKLGSGQLELDFEKISSSLDLLTHFGEANVQLIFPEGKDQEQALAEVETKLETALLRVREMKRGVIET